MKKEPPDKEKYRTIKISLKQIINNPLHQSKLFDAVNRTNQLVIHVYHFLRLWILQCYHTNKPLPTITTATIRMAFTTLTQKTKKTRSISQSNRGIRDEFEAFYQNVYSKLGYENKISGLHLSQILRYMATDILTNIENNIKGNFIKYLHKYVNLAFRDSNDAQLQVIVGARNRKLARNRFKSELNALKNDLIHDTEKSPPEYHQWLKDNRSKLIPPDVKKSVHYDLMVRPQKYLPFMIFMNLEFERRSVKMSQPFPQRTNIYPKYCPFDTVTLIELFMRDKGELKSRVRDCQEEVWRSVFKLDHRIFKAKKYAFDYRMATDGLAVSLQFKLRPPMRSLEDEIRKYASPIPKFRKPINKKSPISTNSMTEITRNCNSCSLKSS